jgi:uncharacterized membrane protein
MMIGFWGGLVAAVVVGVRLFGGSRRGFEEPDATTILRNRYARGEISDQELEERMTVLGSRGKVPAGR